jgi:hypothetical protein
MSACIALTSFPAYAEAPVDARILIPEAIEIRLAREGGLRISISAPDQRMKQSALVI